MSEDSSSGQVGDWIEFRFSKFRAIEVLVASDMLLISIISVGNGKTIAKSSKVVVSNGTCEWPDSILEPIWFSQEEGSKEFQECQYKIVVSMGSTKMKILGVAFLNLTDYLSSLDSTAISLPLKWCNSGTILQLEIHCLGPKGKSSGEKLQSEIAPQLDGHSQTIDDKIQKLECSNSKINKNVHSLSRNQLVGASKNEEDMSKRNQASVGHGDDSSKDLLETTKTTSHELSKEQTMLEVSACKLKIELDTLKDECTDKSKQQSEVEAELFASHHIGDRCHSKDDMDMNLGTSDGMLNKIAHSLNGNPLGDCSKDEDARAYTNPDSVGYGDDSSKVLVHTAEETVDISCVEEKMSKFSSPKEKIEHITLKNGCADKSKINDDLEKEISTSDHIDEGHPSYNDMDRKFESSNSMQHKNAHSLLEDQSSDASKYEGGISSASHDIVGHGADPSKDLLSITKERIEKSNVEKNHWDTSSPKMRIEQGTCQDDCDNMSKHQTDLAMKTSTSQHIDDYSTNNKYMNRNLEDFGNTLNKDYRSLSKNQSSSASKDEYATSHTSNDIIGYSDGSSRDLVLTNEETIEEVSGYGKKWQTSSTKLKIGQDTTNNDNADKSQQHDDYSPRKNEMNRNLEGFNSTLSSDAHSLSANKSSSTSEDEDAKSYTRHGSVGAGSCKDLPNTTKESLEELGVEKKIWEKDTSKLKMERETSNTDYVDKSKKQIDVAPEISASHLIDGNSPTNDEMEIKLESFDGMLNNDAPSLSRKYLDSASKVDDARTHTIHDGVGYGIHSSKEFLGPIEEKLEDFRAEENHLEIGSPKMKIEQEILKNDCANNSKQQSDLVLELSTSHHGDDYSLTINDMDKKLEDSVNMLNENYCSPLKSQSGDASEYEDARSYSNNDRVFSDDSPKGLLGTTTETVEELSGDKRMSKTSSSKLKIELETLKNEYDDKSQQQTELKLKVPTSHQHDDYSPTNYEMERKLQGSHSALNNDGRSLSSNKSISNYNDEDAKSYESYDNVDDGANSSKDLTDTIEESLGKLGSEETMREIGTLMLKIEQEILNDDSTDKYEKHVDKALELSASHHIDGYSSTNDEMERNLESFDSMLDNGAHYLSGNQFDKSCKEEDATTHTPHDNVGYGANSRQELLDTVEEPMEEFNIEEKKWKTGNIDFKSEQQTLKNDGAHKSKEHVGITLQLSDAHDIDGYSPTNDEIDKKFAEFDSMINNDASSSSTNQSSDAYKDEDARLYTSQDRIGYSNESSKEVRETREEKNEELCGPKTMWQTSSPKLEIDEESLKNEYSEKSKEDVQLALKFSTSHQHDEYSPPNDTIDRKLDGSDSTLNNNTRSLPKDQLHNVSKDDDVRSYTSQDCVGYGDDSSKDLDAIEEKNEESRQEQKIWKTSSPKLKIAREKSKNEFVDIPKQQTEVALELLASKQLDACSPTNNDMDRKLDGFDGSLENNTPSLSANPSGGSSQHGEVTSFTSHDNVSYGTDSSKELHHTTEEIVKDFSVEEMPLEMSSPKLNIELDTLNNACSNDFKKQVDLAPKNSTSLQITGSISIQEKNVCCFSETQPGGAFEYENSGSYINNDSVGHVDDSSINFLDTVEETIEELSRDGKMWETNSPKLKIELQTVQDKCDDQSKKPIDLTMEISTSHHLNDYGPTNDDMDKEFEGSDERLNKNACSLSRTQSASTSNSKDSRSYTSTDKVSYCDDSSKDLLDKSSGEKNVCETSSPELKIESDTSNNVCADKTKQQVEQVLELHASNSEEGSIRQGIGEVNSGLVSINTSPTIAGNPKSRDSKDLQREIKDEMYILKESNANLSAQLNKTQEANLELVSILQELEETIEVQRAELSNPSKGNHVIDHDISKNVPEVHEGMELARMLSIKEDEITMLREKLNRILNVEKLDDPSSDAIYLKLEKENDFLKIKIQELQNDCSELTEENLDLVYKLKEISASEKVEDTCVYSSEEMSNVSDHHASSRNKVKFLDEKCADLELKLANFISQYNELDEKFQTSQDEVNKRNLELNEMREKISHTRELEEAITEVDDLKHRIMLKDQEIEGLKNSKKEMKNVASDIQGEKSQLEEQLTTSGELGLERKSSDYEKHQMMEEISGLKIQVQNIANLQDDVLKLQSSLKEAMLKNGKLEELVRKLSEECEELKTQKAILTNKVSCMESTMNDAEQEKQVKSMEENHVINQGNDEVSNQDEVTPLNEDLESQSKTRMLETRIAELLQENKLYRDQLESPMSEESTGGDGKKNSDDKLAQLESELKDMKERLLNVSMQYAEVEAQREHLVMELKNATAKKGRWF